MNVFLKGIILIIFMLLGLQIRAENPFVNAREGKSHYLGLIANWQVNRLQSQIFLDQVFPVLKEALNVEGETPVCEFDILEKLEKGFSGVSDKSFRKYGKRLLLLARQKDMVDDTTLRMLKEIHRFREKSKKYSEPKSASVDVSLLPELARVYSEWKQIDEEGTCLYQSWSYLLEELDKSGISLSKRKMKKYNRAALKNGNISLTQFQILELARRRDIHNREMNLKEYQEKLTSVQTHILEKLGAEIKLGKSKFLSSRMKEENFSYRERLYKIYSAEQIIAMGELVRRYWVGSEKGKKNSLKKSFFRQAGILAGRPTFKGIQVQDVDFVAAALEVGVENLESENALKNNLLAIFSKFARL